MRRLEYEATPVVSRLAFKVVLGMPVRGSLFPVNSRVGSITFVPAQ